MKISDRVWKGLTHPACKPHYEIQKIYVGKILKESREAGIRFVSTDGARLHILDLGADLDWKSEGITDQVIMGPKAIAFSSSWAKQAVKENGLTILRDEKFHNYRSVIPPYAQCGPGITVRVGDLRAWLSCLQQFRRWLMEPKGDLGYSYGIGHIIRYTSLTCHFFCNGLGQISGWAGPNQWSLDRIPLENWADFPDIQARVIPGLPPKSNEIKISFDYLAAALDLFDGAENVAIRWDERKSMIAVAAEDVPGRLAIIAPIMPS